MENGWNLFTQNGNCPRDAWDIWALGCTSSGIVQAEEETVNRAHTLAADHALLHSFSGTCSSMGVGSDPIFLPDPLVVSLNLNLGGGKSRRHTAADQGDGIVKRGKSYVVGGGGAGEPRCQVEGCKVGLENAKGYHRKHKVCEMHAKAPKVMLLGHEQRFCQQCSRFHAVSEFDESKRSCRRRLAGHNERRRKISQDSSTTTKSPCHDYKLMMAARRYHQNNKRAHSLLSTKNDFLVSPATDLAARCSAALNDPIAENRAAISATQISLQATDSDSIVNKHPSVSDFHFK